MTPSCKTCNARGWVYKKGDPTRHTCEDCKGSGKRTREQILAAKDAKPKFGPRKLAKMSDIREFKRDYLEDAIDPARPVYIEGAHAVPCQTCRDPVPLHRSEFSHKKAAGMGGAGDEGGRVSNKNGTYSCRCCHGFIEQDRQAKDEHEASPANISNTLTVEFSAEVQERYKIWRGKWFNTPIK